jgi:hypothetical protein
MKMWRLRLGYVFHCLYPSWAVAGTLHRSWTTHGASQTQPGACGQLVFKKEEGSQLTHWNFIIYGQVFEKMFLYEDEDNQIGINRHDENELGKFIQGLKWNCSTTSCESAISWAQTCHQKMCTTPWLLKSLMCTLHTSSRNPKEQIYREILW